MKNEIIKIIYFIKLSSLKLNEFSFENFQVNCLPRKLRIEISILILWILIELKIIETCDFCDEKKFHLCFFFFFIFIQSENTWFEKTQFDLKKGDLQIKKKKTRG